MYINAYKITCIWITLILPGAHNFNIIIIIIIYPASLGANVSSQFAGAQMHTR